MKKNTIIATVLGLSTALFISSCQKERNEPSYPAERNTSVNSNSIVNREKKVYISNLDELYATVNDPGNAGTQVVLAAGTYVLNASYPNGGRLELQTDMSLRGQPGQVDAVLIDQSALPFASFRLSPTVSVAPIRIGRGTNSLEWLSVKGGAVAANPLSVIESDLIGAETNVTISHVYVDCNGSRIGILLRNRLQEHANRVINATLEHTEIENAFSNPNPPGAGLALQNRISGSQINLKMTGNYIHRCRVGVLHFNGGLGNNIEHCAVDIISHNDRIEGNGCGIDLSAGSGTATAYSNNGRVTVKMYGTIIKNNGLAQLVPTNGALLSGIYAAGAYGAIASNNLLNVSLWGCDISNNNAPDIYAYGAFSPTAVVAGTNNHFDLHLYGLSANATIESAASIPVEPAGTNMINVLRN
jgi:hypothetical protein